MERAPFHHALAEGPAARASWLITADGTRIRAGYWTFGGAEGTVLLFPGRSEYIEKYGRAAGEYAARGLALVAIDWRGQGLADRGRADRALGFVERFSDYQLDVDALLAWLDAEGVPKPWYLVGHSMGGAIGLRALHRGLPVEAAAFSAPMWGIKLSPPLRAVAWGLTWAARKSGTGARYAPSTEAKSYVLAADFDGNTLTRDRDHYDYMRRQITVEPDLALGGASLHWLFEALVEMRLIRRLAPPPLPCATWLGDNERIVDPAPIKQVMARWPNGALHIIKDAEHEIMMETQTVRDQFFDGSAALFKSSAEAAPQRADAARKAASA